MIFFCGISNCGGRPQGAPIGYPQQKALTRRYPQEGKARRKKVFLEIESGLQRKGPAGQSGLCSIVLGHLIAAAGLTVVGIRSARTGNAVCSECFSELTGFLLSSAILLGSPPPPAMIFFWKISRWGGCPQGAPIGYPQQKDLTRRSAEEGGGAEEKGVSGNRVRASAKGPCRPERPVQHRSGPPYRGSWPDCGWNSISVNWK